MSGQEIQKRTPMEDVCATLDSPDFRARVAQALPENVSLDRFTRATLIAVQTAPELITADRGSLYLSVVKCAADGLLPDNREAALVIFRSKGRDMVQYLPMVFGLRKKAAEHGFSLSAYTVHEHDVFRYSLGLEPHVTHEPPALGEERGDVIGAYAVATDLEHGAKYLEVMDRAEIEKVRAVSRAATSEHGPWVKWYEEQCKKTVARRLYKTLPLGASPAVTGVMDAHDAEYPLPSPEGRMTVEEANLSATLNAGPPVDDSGPDDALEGEVVDNDGQTELTFAEQAERAQRARAAQGVAE